MRNTIAALGLFHMMRREHDRHVVAAAELLEVAEEFAARHRIEPGAGLIEEQHFGLMQHRLRQLDAPAHAARERLDQVARRDW